MSTAATRAAVSSATWRDPPPRPIAKGISPALVAAAAGIRSTLTAAAWIHARNRSTLWGSGSRDVTLACGHLVSAQLANIPMFPPMSRILIPAPSKRPAKGAGGSYSPR